MPAKDHFLRAAAEYGKGIRILRQDPLKCSSPLLSPKGNPFPHTEFRGKTLSCRRKGNYKNGRTFTHFLPVSAREIICQ
ncbi:MAG: hypothetical protein ACLUIQ_08580 [Dialister invisus]